MSGFLQRLGLTSNAAPPPMPPPANFPVELTPENWQAARGRAYRAVVPRTGLSARLRAVQGAFQVPGRGETAIPVGKLGDVPSDPGALAEFFNEVLLAPKDNLMAEIDETQRHIDAMRRGIQASAVIPSSEREKLGNVANQLEVLRSTTLNQRIAALRNAVSERQRLRDACRAKLEAGGGMQACREIGRNALGYAATLSAAIPNITTIADMRTALSNTKREIRSLFLLKKNWNDIVKRQVPSVVHEFGADPMDGQLPIITALARSEAYISRLGNEIEADIARRLAVTDDERIQAGERRSQRNNEWRMARQAIPTLEARGHALPPNYVADTERALSAARAEEESLRRMDLPTAIAVALRPLRAELADVPNLVNRSYDVVFARLNALIGLNM